MDGVRGGLCLSLFASVETETSQGRTEIIKEWNKATRIFVQQQSRYPFIKRNDTVFVLAGFGKDSPQELIVRKFWEAVYTSNSPSSLVSKADELVAAVEMAVRGRLFKILQGLEERAAPAKIQSLKNEVSRCLFAEIVGGSKLEKIVQDYAQYQVNIWIACQIALLGSDLLFERLDVLHHQQKNKYVAFQVQLIKASFSSLGEQLKEARASLYKNPQEKGERLKFLSKQFWDCHDELSRLDEQAERISSYPEIDALYTLQFRKQVYEWQEKVVSLWEKIMKSEGEIHTLNWFLSLIEKSFKRQAEQGDEEELLLDSPLLLRKQQAKNLLWDVTASQLWDDAYLTFIQIPSNRALIEQSEKAFVLAGFGADSPQYVIVTKFWEMIREPSLLCNVFEMLQPLMRYATTSLIEQILPILVSLTFGEKKTDTISEVLDSLNQEVCQVLGVKDTYESEQEKILHEYARFSVNRALALTFLDFKTEMVFNILAHERQADRERYVIAHKSLLDPGFLKTHPCFSTPDDDAHRFFSSKETQERLAHLDQEAQRIYRDMDEIEVFALQMRTPFYRAANQFRKLCSTRYQEFLARDETSHSGDDLVSLIKQKFEDELKLFASLPPKKAVLVLCDTSNGIPTIKIV